MSSKCSKNYSYSYMLSFIIIPDKNLDDDTFACISTKILGKEKERKDDLYSAFILRIISKRSGMDHTVTCKYTMPAFPSSHSLEVATSTKYSSIHPIAAYYSFIDPQGMKGWVGLVGWPVADGLPTLVVIHQVQVELRTEKVAGQRPTL